MKDKSTATSVPRHPLPCDNGNLDAHKNLPDKTSGELNEQTRKKALNEPFKQPFPSNIK